MTTPISILDRLFEATKHLAKKLCMSWRELYSKAFSRFIDESDASGITEKLNAVYESKPELSQIDPFFTRLQIESLPEEDW